MGFQAMHIYGHMLHSDILGRCTFVNSVFQDEGLLQVTILNYPSVLQLAQAATSYTGCVCVCGGGGGGLQLTSQSESRHSVFMSCLQMTQTKARSDTEIPLPSPWIDPNTSR